MVASTREQKSKEQAAAPQTKRSIARTALVIVACQIIALLAVELILSFAGLGEEEIFQFDKEIGPRHMVNKKITWRTEGFATSYFDADGMREPGLTLQKPANTYRVALLGDSLVEGLQVPIEQTFGSIIAKRLSPLDGKQVQVLNFGTSGYSTVQEYLQLKRQVLKYQPDLVLLCYNNRDLFENWSPPDQVVTNVRPAAIHLPGGHLIVDSTPIVHWMRSPRGRFLTQVGWLRQNSRIWGLFSALDLEWSMHNPWYRAVLESIAHPKKAFGEFWKLAIAKHDGPGFSIQFFEQKAAAPRVATAPPAPSAAAKPAPAASADTAPASHAFNSMAPNEVLSKSPVAAKAVAEASKAPPAGTGQKPKLSEGEQNYKALVARTFASLVAEMKEVCRLHGARLAVVGMPARGELSPFPGTERSFAGIDYPQELDVVGATCSKQNIPFFNCENRATALNSEQRADLFYTVHLTPQGQAFVASQVEPFVREQLQK